MTSPGPPEMPARGEHRFASSAAGARLPPVLAISILLAAVLVALGIDPGMRLSNSMLMKGLVAAVGTVVGFRVFLSSSEARLRVSLRQKDLLFEFRGRQLALPFDEIESLDYEPPFRHYSRWLPAMVVVDRGGARFRIPALVAGGDELVHGLVERCGRSDLATWAEVNRLDLKMARERVWVVAGYLAAAAFVAAAAVRGLP